jgi:hypothetical protein
VLAARARAGAVFICAPSAHIAASIVIRIERVQQ